MPCALTSSKGLFEEGVIAENQKMIFALKKDFSQAPSIRKKRIGLARKRISLDIPDNARSIQNASLSTFILTDFNAIVKGFWQKEAYFREFFGIS